MSKYSEQHGAIGEFFWLESNGIRIPELLDALPEVVEGKYVIRTMFDSEGLVPYGRPAGVAWEKWQDLGNLGIIASVHEINPTDYDSYFTYSSAPDPSLFKEWKALEPALRSSSFGDPEVAEKLLQALHKLSPDSYIDSATSPLSFATKDKALFLKLLASNLVTGLPTKHELEAERSHQHWLKSCGGEVGPETCESKGCERLRIKFGIFCARHHIEMLNKTACDFD